MKQTKSFTIQLATPILAVFILAGMWGAFLFDTDGAAIGLTYLGIAHDTFFAAVWRLIGDCVWVFGVIAAVLAAASIASLVKDERATQTALLRYLTTRADQTPVSELYPNHIWAKPVFYANSLIAIIGMASGFWFTGTVWLVSMIATHANHKKLRGFTRGFERLALEKGLDAVRDLAAPETISLLKKAEQKD